jgi:hypothetical protein
VRRAAAVLLAGPRPVPPPGIDAEAFARAMAEDVVDVVVGMAGVEVVIAHTTARAADAMAVRWPGATMTHLGEPAAPALAALAALADAGCDVGTVVAPDAPDLPGLVLAKPFSALSSAPVAAAPATGGGLVALAAQLPMPGWLIATGVGLDTADPIETLQVAAPRRKDARSTMSWHRLRTAADVGFLDPGLEGWEATRALLGR